jgi:hypothetical protein
LVQRPLPSPSSSPCEDPSADEPARRPNEVRPVQPRFEKTARLFGATEIEGGFPHSEIPGSKPVRGSPGLIAAYHVLHRLSAPRHPPDTLMALDCSHRQSAFVSRGPPIGKSEANTLWREKTSFASNASGDPGGQPKDPRLVARRLGFQGQTINRATASRPARLLVRPIRPSTECASSSQCQISKGQDPSGSQASQSRSFRKAPRLIAARLGPQRNETDQNRIGKDRGDPRLVEPDGIEPTTSCLQSTRSPN